MHKKPTNWSEKCEGRKDQLTLQRSFPASAVREDKEVFAFSMLSGNASLGFPDVQDRDKSLCGKGRSDFVQKRREHMRK